jgi:hypothetical protein
MLLLYVLLFFVFHCIVAKPAAEELIAAMCKQVYTTVIVSAAHK